MTKLKVATADRLAILTLADGMRRNLFTPELIEDLKAAVDEAMSSDAVGAVLIEAEGPDFSAGVDLREMALLPSQSLEEIEAQTRPVKDLFSRLAKPVKPVIVAVQGAAMGGGCGLACMSSITLAADNARFACSEIRLGLFPFLIMPAMRRAVGDRRALELSLSGRTIGAEEALSLGLVHQVLPAGRLPAEARRLAQQIASSNPDALRIGMQAYHECTGMDVDTALEKNLKFRAMCIQSPNAEEGIRAFLEKRRPMWGGANFHLKNE